MKKSKPSGSPVTVALVLGGGLALGVLMLPKLSKEKLVGSEPRDFALPRLETAGRAGAPEQRMRLSELTGKAVILDFWASWCQPCREQAPIVDDVARSLAGRGLVALGIVTGDNPEAARRFLAEHPVHYPSVVDEQDEAARAFGVQGLPTIVALDRTGRVVAVRRQVVHEAELLGIAEAALKE